MHGSQVHPTLIKCRCLGFKPLQSRKGVELQACTFRTTLKQLFKLKAITTGPSLTPTEAAVMGKRTYRMGERSGGAVRPSFSAT